MPRGERRKSNSGIYHIMLRGINRQSIFENDDDCQKFIEILKTNIKAMCIEIYAYCLMGNHVHLLMKEGKEAISNTMKRIGGSYVYWYNWQYGRIGPLFQDRFKSEAVEDDSYFLTVLRYIHQNPVKAGLVEKAENYEWSSYREYFKDSTMVNLEFALKILGGNKETARAVFMEFNNEGNKDTCLEMTDEKIKSISDREVRQVVLEKYGFEIISLQAQSQEVQQRVLKYLKEMPGTSLRQVSRLTGLTVNKIFRA
jgi:putative transposase